MQLENIPRKHLWKENICESRRLSNNLIFHGQHLYKNNQIASTDKLTAEEIYLVLFSSHKSKLSLQEYFQRVFGKNDIELKIIYLIPGKVVTHTFISCCQYKTLNKILLLNKHLAVWRLFDSALCSFCDNENETAIHIFLVFEATQNLWSALKVYLEIELSFHHLTSRVEYLDSQKCFDIFYRVL